MALVDLIANSGAKNFETMRKGWLPTAEETNARRMSELGIQRMQQKIDYEPERQKIERDSKAIDLNYKKSLIAQHERETEKYKTSKETTARNLEIKNRGRLMQEAAKLGSVEKQKKLLSSNFDSLFPEGTPQEKIDGFKGMINNPDDKAFTKQFSQVRQGNKYLQGLAEKMFGKTESYYNPNTKQLDQVAKDSPDYYSEVRRLKSEGYVQSKKLGIDLKGESGKLGTKKAISLETRKSDRTEELASLSNTIAGYGELTKFVSNDLYKPGFAGDAVDIANDIVQQGKEIFGSESALNADGTIDYDKIEKGSGFFAEIRKMASIDRRKASALMEMAYLKAKSLDKGGKVTDADYRFAKRMLENGMDKSITLQILRDGIKRIEGNFNRTSDIYNEEYGDGQILFQKINADKIMGWGEFAPQTPQQEDFRQRQANLQKRKAALAERRKVLK